MNRFLTDEQAAYLAQLYTGTDAPKLHKAPTMYVHDLERRYKDRGYRIQHLERLVHERKEQVEKLNVKLFKAMCSRNRAYNRIKELEDRLDDAKTAAEFVDTMRIHAEIDGIERGKTIHRLERRLHKANRKYAALHRAMRALINSAYKSVVELGWPPTPSPAVEESAYGSAWPRFADGAPVVIGDCVKGVMCDVRVASIVFREDCVLLYDAQMFHYVKLDGGERAQRPDGTRLALD